MKRFHKRFSKIFILIIVTIFVIIYIESFNLPTSHNHVEPYYFKEALMSNQFNDYLSCKIAIISKPSQFLDSLVDNLKNSQQFVSNCGLRVFILYNLQNSSDFKINSNENYLTPVYFDENHGSESFIQLITETINENKFSSLLINQNVEINSSAKDLINLCQNLIHNIKIYYKLNFTLKYKLSLELIGFLRQIEMQSTYIIVDKSFDYYSLVHSYGINKNKTLYISNSFSYVDLFLKNTTKSNIFEFKASTKPILNYLNSSNINKYIKGNYFKTYCLYADFNVQLNIQIDIAFYIISIGLVNQNLYALANLMGFESFKLNNDESNDNLFQIDHQQQKLTFESINIGFVIERSAYELNINFYKMIIQPFSFALGLIVNDQTKNSDYSQWKIKDGDIFSHDNEEQTSTCFGKYVNIYKFTAYENSQKNKLVEFQIEGPAFMSNSFAQVNRKLYLSLYNLDQSIQVTLDPEETTLRDYESDFEILLVYSLYKSQSKHLKSNEKVIILRNTGDFIQRPELKKNKNYFKNNQTVLIHHQPWEFGAVPIEWIAYFNKIAHEIWVPSNYNRLAFKQNGVYSNKIHVIPHGIFLERFTYNISNLYLPTVKKFKFLTIGGSIPRKGFDLILEAYTSLFTSKDDVSLIIQSIYGDKSILKRVKALKENSTDSPEIIFLKNHELTSLDIIRLYKSVDVYLSPYRSEGFGLTILEAMASGIPPIVTKYGPALEFCSNKCCLFIEAKEQNCFIRPCGNMSIFGFKTIYQPKWSEPSVKSLRFLMYKLFKSKSELAKRSIACKRDAKKFTWKKTAEQMIERIHKILG